MSCSLRAHGQSFEVHEFLEKSSLQPDAVYEKGDPIVSGKKNGSQRSSSGFTVSVSQADLSDLEGQIGEAILFLDEYEEDLRCLGNFSGVDAVSLEFEVQWREASVQTDVFPADLLWRAGALDIWLAVTRYSIAGKGGDGDPGQKN